MENYDLLAYTKKTIIETQKHLESIREMVDVGEGLDEISSRLNGETLMEESHKIIYFNSLVTISKLNVAIILKNLVTAEFEWEKLYFIKQAHLIIHETLKTYDTTHNRILYELTSRYPELNTNFEDLRSDLKSFRKKTIQNDNNEIRNCTAHIDQDFKKYYDTLLKVDAPASLEITAEFIKLMDKMFIFSLQCLEINSPENADLDEIQKKLIDLKSKLLEKTESKG